MYTELSLDALPEVPDYRSTTDAGGRTERILTGLGRVNLFVGRNNSGKSRLLRAIYKAETLHFATAELPRGHIRAIVEPVRRALEAGFDRARTVGSYGQVSRDFLDPVTPDDLLDRSKISNQLTELRDRLTTLTHDPRKFSSHGGKPGMAGYVDQNEIAAIHNSVWPLAANALELLKAINISPAEPRFYIPVLRGLRPLSGSTDPYAARTQGDYGLPAPDQHRTIFTGLGLYAALDTLVRGSPEQRAGKSEYEAFLSAQFFLC